MAPRRVPRLPAGDLALAALVTLFAVIVTRRIEPSADISAGERQLDGLGYACIVLAGGSLALRRRLPLTVVGLVTCALLGYLLRGYVGGPVFVTLYIALFSLATIRDRMLAFAAAGLAAGTLVAVGLAADNGPEPLVHLLFVAWAVAAVLLGDAVRSRWERVSAMEQRARQLEQSREDEARRRVAEERLRIARDLHDSVAHTMATINVHAGAAAHVIDRRPDQARSSLRVIEQASHEVLDELAAMLELLRFDGDAPAADRRPTPGLAQLGALVESVRRAGLDVTLQADPPHVPQPVGVAAYRIVQESLTNVLRHSAGAGVQAQVTLEAAADGGLVLEVTDNGCPAAQPAPGTGVGIVGMRERAEATGGRLEAGARADGGFAVRATWPAHP